MVHTLKILFKKISNRIFRKVDADISDTKFRFCKGQEAREALFAHNFLSQRCLDMNEDLQAYFISYVKVRHDRLVKTLVKRKVNLKDTRYGQKNRNKSRRHSIRLGCILLPLIFNLHSEDIVNKELDGQDIDIEINSTMII